MKEIVDFFILGAPKCGTTALHEILNRHPEIYLPTFKEPHYFAHDLEKYKAHDSFKEFISLYKESDRKINGDASIFGLFSEVAANEILKHNKKAKFILMLRRQYEAVPSFHSQVIYTQDEEVIDFKTAWDLSSERRKNQNKPKTCRCSKILDYKDLFSYGDQIERLYKKVATNNILIIFHEDFTKNYQPTIKEILEFLEVKNIPLENKISNPNTTNRINAVARILRHPPKVIRKIKRAIFGRGSNKLYEKLLELNTITKKRSNLSSEMKREIIENYRSDIEKLEKITKRDLSEWKSQTA